MDKTAKNLVKKVANLVDENEIDYALRMVAMYGYMNSDDEETTDVFWWYESKFFEYEHYDYKTMHDIEVREAFKKDMYERLSTIDANLTEALKKVL